MDSDKGPGMLQKDVQSRFSRMENISNFRRHVGMRYYVLWLLSREPMRGSEIISTILRQTMGWWKPSPGTIYPLLGALQSEGLVERLQDHSYKLTDAGYEQIGIRKDSRGNGEDFWTAEKAILEIESFVSFLEDAEIDDASRRRIEMIIERLEKLKVN